MWEATGGNGFDVRGKKWMKIDSGTKNINWDTFEIFAPFLNFFLPFLLQIPLISSF